MCESDEDPSICCYCQKCVKGGVTTSSKVNDKLVGNRRKGVIENISESGKLILKEKRKRNKNDRLDHLASGTVNTTPNPTRYLRSSTTLSLAKLLIAIIGFLPAISAYPLHHASIQEASDGDSGNFEEDSPDFWLNMSVSAILVLLGGVFAGLTLGLMGQDEIYLEVMKQSGTPSERKSAVKVLSLLSKGKHWVLVTLLLSNVITNETLPIVLDRCLGGGWPAVVSSTVAIVIFGEIIPQSISVRYGLAVGSAFAPFVIALMYVMYPVAYPIALLLDYILGEDHGTVYKKAGLKTLVTLHKNMGVERLNEDEVTIISAVLDLKEKPVGTIMTPMEDVFVLSADTILDEKTMEQILHTGFNRIPIHHPGEPENFVGMLLVRILITYDPEDALPISSFPLATLPETGPDTSCLNILNYFQEGKSHMIIVSDNPGEPYGALGVLTLEDVIEELIGEEIVDESDVYIDVHKAIRRAHPGPLTKTHSYINAHNLPLELPNGRSESNGSITTATRNGSVGDSSTTDGTAATSTTIHTHHRPNYSSPRPSMGFENVLSALAQNVSVNHEHTTSNDLPIPKLGPLNKASNPIPTTTRNITVKRALGGIESGINTSASTPLLDSTNLKQSKIEPYNLSHGRRSGSAGSIPIDDQLLAAPSNTKGPISRTEFGALQEALATSVGRRSYDQDHPGDLAYENRVVSPSIPESHNYRTGGIIESVVNVHGVNKVIIEDASTHDELSSRNSPSHSTRSRHSNPDEDDTRPLLSPTI